MPLFYHLSLIIINYRQDKIIFATNILKKFVHKKLRKKSKFNFVLNNYFLKINNNDPKKIFDIIIYYRKHNNKYFDHHFNFLKDQIKKKKNYYNW